MPRATYEDLIAQVRAQIAVDDTIAWAWLLDRSRVLNAETSWLWTEDVIHEMAGREGDGVYALDPNTIWVEAVIVGGQPYQRSTLSAMDARLAGNTGNTCGIYAADNSFATLQIHPFSTADVNCRFVMDVVDDRTSEPPFPTDFDQALIDGAIAIGFARMDERLDSAGYFEGRFISAIDRLKRRRHAFVGRGATQIRVSL